MNWLKVCHLDDLIANSGMGAWVDGTQLALFYVPALQPGVYALDNWDPIGQAFVMARGILGDINGELSVASPLYKQHFSLKTGQCLEQPEVRIRVWPVKVEHGEVWVNTIAPSFLSKS
ncbi:nitrite reductase small subunit NirD [Photobacterium galatheae]|uniref:Nitrite reductase n=1 Tax=Photobacterium galatheae TaxID=1654360 RepID=A0A066RQ85_9GAMM|nr:nitrite reductase small subunit NirD [Photobacterium galatheae]KDM89842.1 nitrite reductase [Photobacterium galatheae]MCM0151138.1 nitrite reductase small subunit NirD [Photobacterium galatheae]